MNQSLIPVAFHGDTLYLVEHNHEPYTPARPICDALGLAWGPQTVKLNEARWKCSHIETVAQDGKKREMLCLPLRKLPGWLMSISPAKVRLAVREKLERYQNLHLTHPKVQPMLAGTETHSAATRPGPDSAGFCVPAHTCVPVYGRVERREYNTPRGGIAPGASEWASVDTRLPTQPLLKL